MNTAEHLEQHLGRIDRGWSSASLPGVQVCLFRDQPVPGVFTLATLGLSSVVLRMGSKREVRQEMLLAARAESLMEDLVKALMYGGEVVRARGRALLRGEVVPLGGRISTCSAATDLYASIPVVYPAGLATLHDSAPATVIVWLFPLLGAEADFIRVSGWSDFEDRLESVDPDLFDLARISVV